MSFKYEEAFINTVEEEPRVKVLVCGGRDYVDHVKVEQTLDHLHEMLGITDVAHGAARGADYLAHKWAQERGIRVHKFPADWERFGKSAGYKRNSLMYKTFKPDLVVAFPGGKGTAMMCDIAEKGGTDVKRIEE